MAQSKKILIVDHEPRALLDMGRVLRSAGYDVLEARTGSEGLRLARERPPQLILLDAALPDISGVDLLRQIRRDADLGRVYVALLMPESTASPIQARALESGADAVVLRTALSRELLARVQALLRRQGTEEELWHSLQEHRATFDAISDSVYLVDMDWKIVDCNLALARFLGKPRSEIIGGRCYELVHGTRKPIPACLGQRVRETKHHEGLVVPMEERWLQVDVDPLLDAEGRVVGSVHVLRDITDVRRTEEALRQTQAELQLRSDEYQSVLAKQAELELRTAEHRLALAKADEAVQAEVAARERTQEVLLGTQAQLELRAREYEEALAKAEAARRESEMARQGAEETLRRVQRELRTVAARAADLVYTWEVESGRVHLLSDTHGRFASATGRFPATIGELQEMIHGDDRPRAEEAWAQHVDDGTPWTEEYRVVHKDGQVAHWAMSAAPLGGEAVPATEWMVAVRDVTAQRRAEKEKEQLTAQVHIRQRMDGLRRLAAGISAEFNRLLAAVLGHVELILARLGRDHPLYADLQAMRKVLKEMAALLRQLLAFSGREVLQPQPLDWNEVVRTWEPKLRRSLGKRIELSLLLAPEIKPVLADAHALEEVLLNLAAQARVAMPQGGAMQVRTADVTLTEAYCRSNPSARPGEYVRLTVAYQGGELAAEALEHVFEPQFATAESGAGRELGSASGRELGVAVVYGLVQQLGGFIEVSQRVGGETAWDVYLPVYVEEEADGAGERGGAGAEELGSLGAEEPAAAEEMAELPSVESAGAEVTAPEGGPVEAPALQEVVEGEEEQGSAGAEEPRGVGAEEPGGAAAEEQGSEPLVEAAATPQVDVEAAGAEPQAGQPQAPQAAAEAAAPPPLGGLASRLRGRLRRVRGK